MSEGLNGDSRFLLHIRLLALSDDATLQLEHELLSLELLSRRFLLFFCLCLFFFFLALSFLLALDETLEELDETYATTGTEGKDPDADNASMVEDEDSEFEFPRCIMSPAEGASPSDTGCSFAAPRRAFAASGFFGSGFEGFEGATRADDWAARGAPSSPQGTTGGDDWAARGAPSSPQGTTGGVDWAAMGAPSSPQGTTGGDDWAAAEKTGGSQLSSKLGDILRRK